MPQQNVYYDLLQGLTKFSAGCRLRRPLSCPSLGQLSDKSIHLHNTISKKSGKEV